MTDKDFHNVAVFKPSGGGLMPLDDKAIDLCNSTMKHIAFKEVTTRDIKYHRAYFGLINFIYSWTTLKFKESVRQKDFYKFIKHLQGNYKVIFKFKDGSEMIEYKSISFARMTQAKFSEYVKNQLPIIYEQIIHQLYDDKQANMIIENIEFEFETYLNRL